ncbi:hypothetical protein [Ectobacillus sp. sgz5001026]
MEGVRSLLKFYEPFYDLFVYPHQMNKKDEFDNPRPLLLTDLTVL